MTKIKLPYIHRFRDRHGGIRHYFRRPGFKRAPLPGLPGSAEFMAAYQAALADQPVPIGVAKSTPGTVSALVAGWYQSADFKQLSDTTKTVYRAVLERFRGEHGDKPVRMLEARHVRRIVAAKAETPAAANRLLSLLRLLMRFAVEDGWRKDDPTLGVRKVQYRSQGFTTWTDNDIATFETKWPIGSRARLALALLLYTGQRRSDVIRMGPQHIRGGALHVRQRKTGERLELPIHPDLAAVLEGTSTEHLTFLTTQQGRPFASPTAFYNWFVECVSDAGLPEGLSPHGLRKAAARRLAEAGCSAHQIAAITGHTTLKEIERYTRAADQRRLAESAVLKLPLRTKTEG